MVARGFRVTISRDLLLQKASGGGRKECHFCIIAMPTAYMEAQNRLRGGNLVEANFDILRVCFFTFSMTRCCIFCLFLLFYFMRFSVRQMSEQK